MKPTILQSIHVLERVPLRFPFALEVPVGVTISSVTMSCTLKRGIDATPAVVLSGAAIISTATSEVFQWAQGHLPNVSYIVMAVATLSNGGVLVRAAELPVISFT